MTFSRVALLSLMSVSLLGCQATARPIMTTPTVGEQSLGEQPYALAEVHAQNQKFTDIHRRIDKLNRRIDVMQRDITGIRSQDKRIGVLEDRSDIIQEDLGAMRNELKAQHNEVERLGTKLNAVASAPAASPAPVRAAPVSAPKPAPAPVARAAAPIPLAPVKQAAPVKAPEPARAKASVDTSGVAGSTLAVTNLRVGENPAYTRVVLDLNGPGTIRHDLDNTEHLLLLEVPGASWKAEASCVMTGSKLLSSFQVMPGSNQVVIQLKRSVRVKGAEILKPDPAHGVGHRAYIDLVAE